MTYIFCPFSYLSSYTLQFPSIRFVCQFNIEGRVTSVNAQLLSDTIYCDEMEFTYTSRAPNITATFAVIWGQSKPLDNPDNIHVLIYRCKEMANNCGMCLSLNEKYQCGWCQVSDISLSLPFLHNSITHSLASHLYPLSLVVRKYLQRERCRMSI